MVSVIHVLTYYVTAIGRAPSLMATRTFRGKFDQGKGEGKAAFASMSKSEDSDYLFPQSCWEMFGPCRTRWMSYG